jgi:hypothetical protein
MHKERSNEMRNSTPYNINEKKCGYCDSAKTDIIKKEGTLVFRWFRHPYEEGKSICGNCHRKYVYQRIHFALLRSCLSRRRKVEQEDLKRALKPIHLKSTEHIKQMGIINKVPANQSIQSLHSKDLFVTGNSQSMRKNKFGKLNLYQRCTSCDNLLGIPATARRLGISNKVRTTCGNANDVKYYQRWFCLDCLKRSLIQVNGSKKNYCNSL